MNDLATAWLPAIPDVHQRLADETNPARVADQCCGVGWSTIALAKAFPHLQVDGYDNDEESITRARALAEQEGVADRVRFEVRDIADGTDLEDTYDVAFVFEAIHDLPHPVEALSNLRHITKDGGSVIVMDENVGESLTTPGDEVERFMASVSVLWCTPQGRVVPDSQVIGTVMRPHQFEEAAQKAGWSGAEVLAVEHPFFRFYRLVA